MRVPDVVSKRNEFTPADEFVEDALPSLPNQFQHAIFRPWLLRYTETVIKRVAYHFATASERGIQQAAQLLCDPEFYETRKRRRETQRRSWREEQIRQEQEQRERQLCPTEEQIAAGLKFAREQVDYHRRQLAHYEKQVEKLSEMKPKNIRLILPRKDHQ